MNVKKFFHTGRGAKKRENDECLRHVGGTHLIIAAEGRIIIFAARQNHHYDGRSGKKKPAEQRPFFFIQPVFQ